MGKNRAKKTPYFPVIPWPKDSVRAPKICLIPPIALDSSPPCKFLPCTSCLLLPFVLSSFLKMLPPSFHIFPLRHRLSVGLHPRQKHKACRQPILRFLFTSCLVIPLGFCWLFLLIQLSLLAGSLFQSQHSLAGANCPMLAPAPSPSSKLAVTDSPSHVSSEAHPQSDLYVSSDRLPLSR